MRTEVLQLLSTRGYKPDICELALDLVPVHPGPGQLGSDSE